MDLMHSAITPDGLISVLALHSPVLTWLKDAVNASSLLTSTQNHW